MSAIAGIYNLCNSPVLYEESSAIINALNKFPVDDIKVWQKDNIFLSCNQRWITPESVGEVNPYFDNERRIAITADAVIDNRHELFNILNVDKQLRKNTSDTSLILLAYQKWGEELPRFLVGEYAFVIWDEKEKKLFGARDFSGSRTLYYFNKYQHFSFCTVMEPLLSLPYIAKKLNEEWLAEYLAIPNMIDSVDTSITVLKDIYQVPPSHSITVNNGNVTLKRYCNVEVHENIRFKKDSEYVEAFREVFQTAVNSKLRTNYPIGAQLSGGLDSGAVVSFAAKSLKQNNRILNTFSSLPEGDFKDWTPKYRMANERPMIKETVNYLDNIQDYYYSFNGKTSLSEIDEWIDILETPYKFFENSVWVKGIFEEASKKGVRVLLNGARGNLGISFGPALDYYSILLKKLKWFNLYRELNHYSAKMAITDKSNLYSIIYKKAFPNGKHKEDYRLPQIINEEFAKKTNILRKLQEQEFSVVEQKKLNIYQIRKKHFNDLFNWNTTGKMNTKLSLKYSLWHRDPTNDIRVIRYCLSVPHDQFVKNGMDRALIRRATEGLLPNKVRLNQQVRGIQGADWVHRMTNTWGLFMSELKQLVRDPIVRDYLNVSLIKRAIRKLENNPIPEWAFDPDLRVLMRSVIVYRFLKNFYLKGGDIYEERLETANVGSIRY